MAQFWKETYTSYPMLAELGKWYAEYLPSSIAAERTFGVMRSMEHSNRMSMGEETFKAELSFRWNSWIVEDEIESRRKRLRTDVESSSLKGQEGFLVTKPV